MQTVRELAKQIDVMGGLGHWSALTDEGRLRRQAALLLVSQDDQITELRRANRDQMILIGILLDQLGGETEVTDAEIVAAEATEVQTFRTDVSGDLIVRSRRLAESP